MPVGPDEFRAAMSQIASAVSIVTTTAADGTPRGITASSVCPLSLQPPLLIVCIDRAIASHPDFAGCIGFTVNVLGTEHVPLAQRFATRGGNKFGAPSLYPDELGLPALSDALVRAACTMYARHDIGDHTILIGMVEHTAIGSGEPVVYFTRRYHSLAELDGNRGVSRQER